MPLLSECIITAIEDARNDKEKHAELQAELMLKLNNMFDFFNKYLGYDANSNEYYRNQAGMIDFAKDMRSDGSDSLDLDKVRIKLSTDNVVDELMGKMFHGPDEILMSSSKENKFHKATNDQFKPKKNDQYKESIQRINDLKNFQKTLKTFSKFEPADNEKIILENDEKRNLENGIKVLKKCVNDNVNQLVEQNFDTFATANSMIQVTRWFSSDSQEYQDMKTVTDKIAETIRKNRQPTRDELQNALDAASKYVEQKRVKKGRPKNDENFMPWTPAGKARYNGAKAIMDATKKILELYSFSTTRKQQRKEARNLPTYEGMDDYSKRDAYGLYKKNQESIASVKYNLNAIIEMVDSEKIQKFQPKYKNIVHTSVNSALSLLNKIRPSINVKGTVSILDRERVLKSLGNEPLYDVIKDKAKLYRHLMTIKKVLEKTVLENNKRYFESHIKALQTIMEALPPSERYRNINVRDEKNFNMGQLFSETVADQIADEKYHKFHNAKAKNSKIVDVVKKNCAAKILAVNILKKVYKENEEKAYPINGQLNVDVLFSAKNIKEVAEKIKKNEWFQKQVTDTLAETVVDPGVIKDDVFDKVGDVIGAVQKDLDHYVNNIPENEVQKKGQEPQEIDSYGAPPVASHVKPPTP